MTPSVDGDSDGGRIQRYTGRRHRDTARTSVPHTRRGGFLIRVARQNPGCRAEQNRLHARGEMAGASAMPWVFALAVWRRLVSCHRLMPWLLGSAFATLASLAIRRLAFATALRLSARPRTKTNEEAPALVTALQSHEECMLDRQVSSEVGSATSVHTPLGAGDGLSQSLLSSSHSGWRTTERTVRVLPLETWQQRLALPESFAHPNVVQLFNVAVCEQTVHIECERTESTVHQLAATHGFGSLPAKTRLQLCVDLASGLDGVHTFGNGTLWHGMVRDDTCLLVRGPDGEWTAKLSEFGVLAERAAVETRLRDMQDGWWPPEAASLVSSSEPVTTLDGKCMDIFGLGCVVAILLSADGQHPFGEKDQREQRIRNGAPVLSTLLHGWPTSLLPFLLRMLGSPPSRRPSSSEVHASICATCEATPAVALPAAAPHALVECHGFAASPTPLARAVAAAGGFDTWQGWSPAARREAIDKALGVEEFDSDISCSDYSVSAISFTSQADVDDFLANIAELAEASFANSSVSNASSAPLMPSPGDETEVTTDESPEEAVDAFLVDIARMVENEENSDVEAKETPEQAVDAFLADLAKAIEAQLFETPVPVTSPVWQTQETEAAEYLRDVSLLEEDSAMSLAQAALAVASTPSKAAAAAASVLDQALTDLEVAAVGRIEHAALKAAATPTEIAFVASEVIQQAVLVAKGVPIQSPVSPESLGQSSCCGELRWSSPSDAIASPVTKQLRARREDMLAQVARRNLNSANASPTDLPLSTMPPIPVELCKNSLADTDSEHKNLLADTDSEQKAIVQTGGSEELAIAQVENFLSDVKTIALTQAVQDAIKHESKSSTASKPRNEEIARRIHSRSTDSIERYQDHKTDAEVIIPEKVSEGAIPADCDQEFSKPSTAMPATGQKTPLTPRSVADKESQERARRLRARLLDLARRKPALAKAAEAHGLAAHRPVAAVSDSMHSPSEVQIYRNHSVQRQYNSGSFSSPNINVRSETLVPSRSPGQLAASSNISSTSVKANDENAIVRSSQKIGASPISARKGRAAAVGLQQRRRRALSSIGNHQAHRLQC